jgi:thiaminase
MTKRIHSRWWGAALYKTHISSPPLLNNTPHFLSIGAEIRASDKQLFSPFSTATPNAFTNSWLLNFIESQKNFEASLANLTNLNNNILPIYIALVKQNRGILAKILKLDFFIKMASDTLIKQKLYYYLINDIKYLSEVINIITAFSETDERYTNGLVRDAFSTIKTQFVRELNIFTIMLRDNFPTSLFCSHTSQSKAIAIYLEHIRVCFIANPCMAIISLLPCITSYFFLASHLELELAKEATNTSNPKDKFCRQFINICKNNSETLNTLKVALQIFSSLAEEYNLENSDQVLALKNAKISGCCELAFWVECDEFSS